MYKLLKIFRLKWKYLLSKSLVYVEKGSSFECGKKTKLDKVKIHLSKGSHIYIGDNVVLRNIIIYISNGSLTIGDYSLFNNGKMPVKQRITISSGSAKFGKYNRIRAERIWIRFNGCLTVGDYVFINEHADVRCDESIKIGNYNQFSYRLKLWDTNTHEIAPAEQRRKRWIEQGLLVDVAEKPKTKPVLIGDDCWVGDSSTILKGTCIGNRCIVGTGTIIPGKIIGDNLTILNSIEIKTVPNVV